MFWFPLKDWPKLNGTLRGVMDKFDILYRAGFLKDGVEIFLNPGKLSQGSQFTPEFICQFRSLPYRSVHIDHADSNFLDDASSPKAFKNLSDTLRAINPQIIIIHASHLKHNRGYRRQLLLDTLGEWQVLVENNGFDNPWGGSTEGLHEVLNDFPEFNFCLDIAHVKDFRDRTLENFISSPALLSRLRQIHYSYSTIQLDHDPYEKKGYPGYGPYHAMFSVMGMTPSDRTLKFISQYPIVLEGVLPAEDKNFELMKKEMQVFQ